MGERVVYKFTIDEITDLVKIRMPVGANICHVEAQNGIPCIWAIVDQKAPFEERTFHIHGTGHLLRAEHWVGTVQIPPFVWHIFED